MYRVTSAGKRAVMALLVLLGWRYTQFQPDIPGLEVTKKAFLPSLFNC
jgi:hypothetical protein